jgi:hypothetical protein
MAIPGRLELPTYGLGNRRSIRLSYGTANPRGKRGRWTLISEEARDRQPARFLSRYFSTLTSFALPFDAGRFSLYAVWHARFDNDLGHAWLRRELAGCAEDQRSRRRHRGAPAAPLRLARSFLQLLENFSRIANISLASQAARHAEIARFQGDRPEQNGDNPVNLCRTSWLGELSVIASRTSVLAIAAIGGLVALAPLRADAQWWRSAPKDFEECADLAEKAKTKQEKTSALAECNAKFAGRRKPTGGYAYYDFMQDRSFDIAGPNPTPEEQRKIDEEYTVYLDRERRNTIAAALAAKQQQPQQQVQEEVRQVSLKTETEKVPVPVASPVKQAARIRAANCAKNSFSCEWPLLSQSIDELKKLFTSSPSKAKRS